MKQIFKTKKLIPFIIILIILSGIALFISRRTQATQNNQSSTALVSINTIDEKIMAEGVVRSQNEAILHFSIGGKLVYLPFKEGDQIYQGQTIASLDTYTLQRQLTMALNNYRVTRNTFDQTNENAQNNIPQGQQKMYLESPYNKNGLSSDTENNVVNDIVKRLVDQNQANLDNSVINVELNNYALSLASLISPIDGIITHEDVTTLEAMVSPAASFIVADPHALIFRANIPENDISFITEGAFAEIKLTGGQKSLSGIVNKIYPDKITLPTGENVYQADIESDELTSTGKFHQDGTVLINNSLNRSVTLVPSWLVLSGHSLWVLENNQPKLRTINTGETVAGKTEIIKGLKKGDQIITDPQFVIKNNYSIL